MNKPINTTIRPAVKLALYAVRVNNPGLTISRIMLTKGAYDKALTEVGNEEFTRLVSAPPKAPGCTSMLIMGIVVCEGPFNALISPQGLPRKDLAGRWWPIAIRADNHLYS